MHCFELGRILAEAKEKKQQKKIEEKVKGNKKIIEL